MIDAGIDPDYRLHVSERLLTQNDGPMLEALKRLNGETKEEDCIPTRPLKEIEHETKLIE